MSSLLIFNDLRILDPSRGLDAQGFLVCEDGRIAACDAGELPAEYREQPNARHVEGAGAALAPAFRDLRSHFREPGYEDRETIESGCAAAAAGGFTDVWAMPNSEPCADTATAIRFVADKATESGLCRVHPVGAITRGMNGSEMVQFGDMVDAGAVAFTDDLRWVRDGGLMRHSMEYAAMLGAVVISHPEDPTLSGAGVMHEGAWSTRLGLAGIPAAAEVSACARDIELVRLTGARLHIPHVSCRDTVELIRAAKAQGLGITAETTPHHLDFTDADCRDYDTQFKVKPPLRSSFDQEALVEGLDDGTIDCIASDHAPHTHTDKERTFAHAPFGVIGLETSFAVAHDRLVRRGPLSPLQLAELMSTRPAAIMGEEGGRLSPGGAADLVLLDLEGSWVPQSEVLRSRGRNCPWLGRSLQGRVLATYLEGRCTFDLRREPELLS
jgi:dihydroorotase